MFCAALSSAAARADTFTAPLSFSAQTGDSGQYLSALFDFHTQFSQIDSITLQLTMPNGYAGTATVADTSMYLRDLWMEVHDANSPPGFGYYLGGTPDPTSLGMSEFFVTAAMAEQFDFDALVVVETDPPFPLWPNFLRSGKGALSMTDYGDYSTNGGPVPPAGFVGTSTIIWSLPGDVSDATLTIVGTAVPEPSSLILLAIGSLATIASAYFALRRS